MTRCFMILGDNLGLQVANHDGRWTSVTEQGRMGPKQTGGANEQLA